MTAIDGLFNSFLNFDRVIEFPQLEDSVYVDHAGTTLYCKTQIEAYHKELLSNLYGNPHSRSQSSRLTTDAIDQIRYRVLQLFNTTSEDYTVIFTSGCTGALKLVAESFDFYIENSCHRSTKEISGIEKCDKEKTDVVVDDPGNHKFKVKSGCFAYLLDNHTSVQGMREIVNAEDILCVEETTNENFKIHHVKKGKSKEGNSLFVYPAQSNYCGRKYPMKWIDKIHQGQMPFQRLFPWKWFVVLDAASYVSTSHLNLSLNKPDFVTLSFYKMFGFPTGIGALLVKNESADILKKTYFGGGTVGVSSPTECTHINRSSLSDRFEDGTVPFLDIIALRHGLDSLKNLGGGMKSISRHTFIVAQYFHHYLQGLHHGNGQQVADIYCHGDFSDPSKQGPIVNFNLKRSDGSYIGFAEVDKMAQLYNIHLRTGCFCNIGACQKYLELTSEQIKDNFEAGHVCGDDKDLINGKPTGSVRISFGYMSTIEDAQYCLKFICDCFMENKNKPNFSQDVHSNQFKSAVDITLDSVITEEQPDVSMDSECSDWLSSSMKSVISNEKQDIDQTFCSNKASDQKTECHWTKDLHLVLQACSPANHIVTNICLYPVKSCGAFEVRDWEICETGLKFDREWMIVSESGVTISQKREPKLCLIKPQIDLVRKCLVLRYPDLCSVTVPLDSSDQDQGLQSILPCVGKVCGDRVTGVDCGDTVGQWISEVLDKPGCRLIQQDRTRSRKCKLDKTSNDTENVSKLSLANESQYLLICRQSVEDLQQRIQQNEEYPNFELENLLNRFRANIIIGGGLSFEEDSWATVFIGNNKFLSQGSCTRCQMVCLDQETSERSKEPLKTLAAWRGKKIPFGIHLRHDDAAVRKRIHVGDTLSVR
ncbi:ABA3 [Mytilus coruscus]|uniref:Molybdenum cofactor sulfurase n=1 Tax=Mytilus coruscus TaxID=42192 RepID=A0A6J8DDW9_MYTCO|nr:ABA3 [Mytilus coruscus]